MTAEVWEDQPNRQAEARVRAVGLPKLSGADLVTPNEIAQAIAEPALPDLSGYQELRVWAESFEDAQDYRKRLANRLGYKADGSAQKTGARVPRDLFEHMMDPIKQSEHVIELALHRSYRCVAPPGVIAWQKATFGIGEHLAARLLGTLGHPRIATPFHWEGAGTGERKLIPDLPYLRTVRELWAYCGRGDPERKRRKGMTAEEAFGLGSPRCKMLTYLLAESTVKTFAPVEVYDAWLASDDLKPESRIYLEGVRAKCRVEPKLAADAIQLPADLAISPDPLRPVATARHSSAGRELSTEPMQESNATVGTVLSAGQPRPVSTARYQAADRRYRVLYDQRRAHTAATQPDWSDGHSHNDALRIVGKAILKDLWIAAE